MPNWIDLSIAVFFAGALLLEFRRGFGRAIFDLAALLLALRITWALNEQVSGALQFASNPETNRAAIYVGVFLIAGASLMLVGKLLHSTTLVSTDVFEPGLGAICGLGIATITAHVLVQGLALGTGSDTVPGVVAGSVLGMEFLRFDTYHQVLELLYNFHRDPVV